MQVPARSDDKVFLFKYEFSEVRHSKTSLQGDKLSDVFLFHRLCEQRKNDQY